jgi:peptidyl-prolyl cis-trans isomerase D
MAIIGKIRQFSGLTIVIIGIALAAFVLGDLGKSYWRGSGNAIIGKIDGIEISYLEFEQAVEHQRTLINLNNPQNNITNEQMFSLRDQVWNNFVDSIIYDKQFHKLGMAISADEVSNLIYGDHPHQYIVSSFTNPQTGQMEKETMINFFKNVDQLSAEQRLQVANLLIAMQDDALKTKYNTLINKSYYAPKALAEMRYNDANEKAVIELVQLPYSAIPDSTLTITEADYQKYYNEHKELYKQEESRKIEYVIFDIRPSASDIADAEHRVTGLYNELSILPADEVSYFVNKNTDGTLYDSTWLTQSKLPVAIAESIFANEPGTTLAPYRDGDYLYTTRLMTTTMRSDSMEAEHILIPFQGSRSADSSALPKERAQVFADSLARVLRTPMNSMLFGLYALQYSKDPSVSQNSGKLDRFPDGAMVSPFNEAIQKGKQGDIVTVETDFGFHIIKIGHKNPAQKMVRVATVAYQLRPSETTIKGVYAQASKFSVENRTLADFRATAETENFNVRQMDYIQPMGNNITGVAQARQVIRWAYGKDTKDNDTKLNDVSEVINTGDNQFVVAALSEIHPKGYASLESQKIMMEQPILRDKKGDMLIEKAKSYTGTDLNEIATQFNGIITEEPIQISFSTMMLPNGYGREYNVIGTAFGIKENSFKGAIKGTNGVYFMQEKERIAAEPKENYNDERTQLENGFSSRSSQYQTVLKKKTDVVDNRYLYY